MPASKKNHSDTIGEISKTKKTDNTKYYITKDTLIITPEFNDTLKYEKEEFNLMVDNHPELFSEYTQDPYQCYNCKADITDFASECGKDNYFILYAHLLKQKNGLDNNKVMRKKMIAIYKNINSLFAQFQNGGSYFGHQNTRIIGYAEYSIYLYLNIKDDIQKNYDISKQKGLYIKSLRQLIEDENKIANITFETEF